VAAEALAAHDGLHAAANLAHQGTALALRGETDEARAAAEASLQSGSELGGVSASTGYFALAVTALAAGDGGPARDAAAAAWECGSVLPGFAAHLLPVIVEAALAGGDLIAARRWADDAVATAPGWAVLVRALGVRARVATAQGEPEQAERDAHDALASVPEGFPHVDIPHILECLAALAGDAGSHREAARLLGAAHAIRQRMGAVRFNVVEPGYQASVAVVRNALGEKDFDTAWAEGAALSIEEAIAYAQRGRGQRKRPTSGWASLTPAERDVVRLVSEGLANNDIAARLFVSPRTVQIHLTHVYAKLGLSSRVQLVQEAARHT
jgi:DNA-binding CsgD family transcriptional regulator